MLVEPVGHRERLAVIGDRDVLQARRVRRARHRLDIGAAVGLGGVHVQVAAQIGVLDQARQRAGLGRLDLAAVLAQLGRHEGQPERRVDPASSSPATRDSSSRRNSPYSFSLKPRASARSRSAMLCAFEPVKYCSAAPRLSGGTSRRSAWKPPESRTLDLVSPCARTRSTRR